MSSTRRKTGSFGKLDLALFVFSTKLVKASTVHASIVMLPSIDQMMPRAAGVALDTEPFYEARFSCQEVERFAGIALDGAMASQMALESARQCNDSLEASLEELESPEWKSHKAPLLILAEGAEPPRVALLARDR